MVIVDNTELGRRITYKVGNQEKEGTVLSILSTEAPITGRRFVILNDKNEVDTVNYWGPWWFTHDSDHPDANSKDIVEFV